MSQLLFALLLFVGVLDAKPPRHAVIPFFVVGGLMLAFVPPSLRVPVPWNAILGLAIPLLLWQNAPRWANARWRANRGEIGLWLLAAVGFGALLWEPDLEWLGAVLFGIVVASMVWRAIELELAPSHFGQVGPLALMFLLSEFAPAVETRHHYLNGLISGAGVGLGVGVMAMGLSRCASSRSQGWLSLGQVYLAYFAGAVLGVSAVAAAVISTVVYVRTGIRHGLWHGNELRPTPLNTWPGFAGLLIAFGFMGWQAHQPLTAGLLKDVGLGVGVGLAVAWVGRWMGGPTFGGLDSLWRSGLRIGILLIPALLLWPRPMLVRSGILAVALGAAGGLLVLSAATAAAFQGLQAQRDKTGSCM